MNSKKYIMDFKKFYLSVIPFLCLLLVSCENPFYPFKKESTERLTLWIHDEPRLAAYNALAMKFEAEFGIAVDISIADFSKIGTQFLLAGEGNECADMAVIPHDNVGTLVANMVLTEVKLGSKTSNYLPSSIEAFSIDGKLWALPLSVENIGFFYNTELVPVPPQTWVEAIAITEQLQSEGKVDYMMDFPDYLYYMYPILDAFGGSIFGKRSDGSLDSKQVLITEPGFVNGFEFIADLVRDGFIPGYTDYDDANILFESGRAPFIHQGPWALGHIRASGIPYAITAFPGFQAGKPGNPFFGVQGLIINSSSPRAELAHKFAVEFLAREENMNFLFNIDQRPSAWKTIFDKGGDKDVMGFAEAGMHAVPMPNIPQMLRVWDAFTEAVRSVFSDGETPLQALEAAKNYILND